MKDKKKNCLRFSRSRMQGESFSFNQISLLRYILWKNKQTKNKLLIWKIKLDFIFYLLKFCWLSNIRLTVTKIKRKLKHFVCLSVWDQCVCELLWTAVTGLSYCWKPRANFATYNVGSKFQNKLHKLIRKMSIQNVIYLI